MQNFAVALLLLMTMKTLCEVKNFYCPKLASMSLFSTRMPWMSALNPAVCPVCFSVLLAASLSWRCFMEWKTRCGPAVASLRLFAIFFASFYLYTQVPGGVKWNFARESGQRRGLGFAVGCTASALG